MRENKGFTLIEMMIVLAIFIFVLGTILGLMSIGGVTWQSASAKMAVNNELRRGIEQMIRELSEADDASLSLLAGQTAATVSFKKAQDVDTDGAISYSVSTGVLEGLGATDPAISYSVINNAALGFNQLIRTSGGNTTVLANYLKTINVSQPALQFKRTASSPSIIEIIISAEKSSVFRRIMTGTLKGRVILRN